MATHIVLWNLKPELSEEEKKTASMQMKEKLEALQGVVPGLISIKVVVKEIDSCNRDIGLFCEFEAAEDILVYQEHPAHLQAASYVRTVTCDRVCFDW